MKGLAVLIVCVSCVYGQNIVDLIPKCKRSDPNIEKCILDGVEAMRPRFKSGIPEINVPGLEPFNVPKLKLDRNAPNMRIKATVKNGVAYGGSNFKIERLRVNLNNKYAAEAKIKIPHLFVTADYDVKGSKILTLELSGKGRLRGNFTDITVVGKGVAKPIEKDGVQYLNAEKITTKIRIGNAQIAVEDSDRAIAAASAVSFFNASPRIVLDIINPLVEETSAAVVKAFANKILSSVPLNQLLSD